MTKFANFLVRTISPGNPPNPFDVSFRELLTIFASPAGVVRRFDGDGKMHTHIPIVLNADQVAKQLGLSASTLAKMRLSGNGPPYSKLGRRVVYRPEDIETWIASRRFRSTAEYGAAR